MSMPSTARFYPTGLANRYRLVSGDALRGCCLARREIMPILMPFQPSHDRNFKAYYGFHV